MPELTADDLLLGPRGRGLCMAVALRLREPVWTAQYDAARHPGDASRRSALVRALAAVDPGPVRGWRDPLSYLEPMDSSITSAMYWQPPHDEDVILAEPEVAAALRPVAEAIAASPAAAWWTASAEVTAPRYTSLYDDDPPVPPELTGARARLASWRDETLKEERRARKRPADPAAPYGGTWWSIPAKASLVTTTRSLPGLGSVRLAWEEDSFGRRNATIWPLAPHRPPRVWEIDGPAAWTALVDRYPLDVTYERRHVWYQTTGRDGAWRIPDWHAVAEDWDAAHLTVAGYLTTATRALPLTDGTATVLAGWDPDQTWWLSDLLTPTTTHPETWHRPPEPYGPEFAWRRGG